jgi:ABC-type transport system involved in multi-copper enzyme maturation permease subunit
MSGRRDIGNIVSAEILKFRRRRSTIVLPAILVVLAAVIYFGIDLGARRHWFGLPSGYFVAASAIAWITNAVTLALVIATSFVISQEYALGTVKAVWVRPVSRRAWYTAKNLVAGGAVTLCYLITVAVVIVLAAARSGFTDLMEKDYLIHSAGSLGLRLLLTTALTLCAIWAATLLTAAVASKTNHPGGAIAVTIGMGIAMLALSQFPPVGAFLPTTYLGAPSEQMIAMSKGLPLPYEWGDLVWKSLVASGLWGLLAYLAGLRIVSKKEITG